MKFILLLALSSLATTAFAIEADISGNIEGQYRHVKNNDEAKEDLYQNWDSSNFNLVYGNLNGKVTFDDNSFVDVNWFVRYTSSDLYKNNYIAPQIYTFPRKLVARDVFQLQHKAATDHDVTESILNKFYYQMDSDSASVMVGRFYVNYGQGEIFNPINPFNQPTGLTSIQQVAQGNDGGSAKFYLNDRHMLNVLLLGDKAIENYDEKINTTIWVHGEYQATDKVQLDYVAGQDQNRHKGGGQVSVRLDESLVFAQVLYQTRYIKDDKPSEHLWDVVLGYDQQLTSKWHIRIEGGHQKKNRYADYTNFGSDRFLPSEYFAALANTYEVHPLVKLGLTIINDVKTGFNYGIFKSTVSLGDNLEGEIFAYSPVGKGSSADNQAQKLVTQDIGAALRAFF